MTLMYVKHFARFTKIAVTMLTDEHMLCNYERRFNLSIMALFDQLNVIIKCFVLLNEYMVIQGLNGYK